MFHRVLMSRELQLLAAHPIFLATSIPGLYDVAIRFSACPFLMQVFKTRVVI